MKLESLKWKEFNRVAVFIDAANIIYSCKSLGWHIKYEKLYLYFKNNCRLTDVYFYYAAREDNDRDEKLLGALLKIGFKIKQSKVKIFKNSDNTLQVKGNIDGELIVDMMRIKDEYDTAFLMSGDGDFRHVIKYLRELGKYVFIISTKYHVAKELIDASNGYINLKYFKELWQF